MEAVNVTDFSMGLIIRYSQDQTMSLDRLAHAQAKASSIPIDLDIVAMEPDTPKNLGVA